MPDAALPAIVTVSVAADGTISYVGQVTIPQLIALASQSNLTFNPLAIPQLITDLAADVPLFWTAGTKLFADFQAVLAVPQPVPPPPAKTGVNH
jgi:hypothetical protein